MTGRRAVVICASTRAATGVYPDRTGPLIVAALREWGYEVDDGVDIVATVRTADRTGLVVEARSAVCVGALARVDMVKAVDKHARITDVRVTAKSGGRSGDWTES